MLAAGLVIYGAGVLAVLLASATQDGDPRSMREAAAMATCAAAWPLLLFVAGVSRWYRNANRGDP